MRVSSVLAGLFLLAGQALAAEPEFLYEGFTLVSQSEIMAAFDEHGLSPDRVSADHATALKLLYEQKGIDFIGVVEDRDEAMYFIQENPYWILNGYEQFASGRMNKRSQIDVNSLRQILVEKDACLEITKTGPENYSIDEVANLKRYHSLANYICPDVH